MLSQGQSKVTLLGPQRPIGTIVSMSCSSEQSLETSGGHTHTPPPPPSCHPRFPETDLRTRPLSTALECLLLSHHCKIRKIVKSHHCKLGTVYTYSVL